MTGPRHRRTLLRTGAVALTSLAGCVGDFGDGAVDDSTTSETSPATTRTTETTESRTPAKRNAVELVPQSVRSSFFYHTTPDSMDVAAVDGTQFVFVTVQPKTDASSAEDWPSRADFELVADEDRFRATVTPGPIHDPHTFYEQGRVYDPDRERGGWLAFEVPNPLDAEDVAVAWNDREQSLGEKFRADLRAPPADFDLVSFDAPDQVTHDETFEVSCTVENVGAGDGTFRACLNQAGPTYAPHDAAFPVTVGERREWTWAFGRHVSADTESVGFRFRSVAGDRDATIEVISETTTA